MRDYMTDSPSHVGVGIRVAYDKAIERAVTGRPADTERTYAMNTHYQLIEKNLSFVLAELGSQPKVASFFPPESLCYQEQIDQLSVWVNDAGEYGLAYENVVSMLEVFPFKLSAKAAIKLLEVGLIFGFKTELDSDTGFDRR